MAEFIVNPRRAPRAPVRCRTVVVYSSGSFETETEDIGSRGCQLVVPKFVHKGDAVQLTVTNEKLAEQLHVAGHVAWVSAQAPWRVGIAFDEPSVREGTRWFEKVMAAYPGLAGFRRVPERIAGDTKVYLGTPPRFLLDFTADETTLLRAIGSGTRIDELQARLRDRWPAAQRALFSLIARQAVTLSRGQAVLPDTWKKVLSEIEASLAVESLGKEPPGLAAPANAPTPVPGRPPTPPVRAAPASTARVVRPAPAPSPAPPSAWNTQPVQNPNQMIDLPEDEEGPPLELDSPAAAPTPTPKRQPPRTASQKPHPDFRGAGVGWRKGSGARSKEAQGVFDHALAEMHAGNANSALSLLRRALQLAPGDPEIAEALGKLAFKDREPDGR